MLTETAVDVGALTGFPCIVVYTASSQHEGDAGTGGQARAGAGDVSGTCTLTGSPGSETTCQLTHRSRESGSPRISISGPGSPGTRDSTSECGLAAPATGSWCLMSKDCSVVERPRAYSETLPTAAASGLPAQLFTSPGGPTAPSRRRAPGGLSAALRQGVTPGPEMQIIDSHVVPSPIPGLRLRIPSREPSGTSGPLKQQHKPQIRAHQHCKVDAADAGKQQAKQGAESAASTTGTAPPTRPTRPGSTAAAPAASHTGGSQPQNSEAPSTAHSSCSSGSDEGCFQGLSPSMVDRLWAGNASSSNASPSPSPARLPVHGALRNWRLTRRERLQQRKQQQQLEQSSAQQQARGRPQRKTARHKLQDVLRAEATPAHQEQQQQQAGAAAVVRVGPCPLVSPFAAASAMQESAAGDLQAPISPHAGSGATAPVAGPDHHSACPGCLSAVAAAAASASGPRALGDSLVPQPVFPAHLHHHQTSSSRAHEPQPCARPPAPRYAEAAAEPLPPPAVLAALAAAAAAADPGSDLTAAFPPLPLPLALVRPEQLQQLAGCGLGSACAPASSDGATGGAQPELPYWAAMPRLVTQEPRGHTHNGPMAPLAAQQHRTYQAQHQPIHHSRHGYDRLLPGGVEGMEGAHGAAARSARLMPCKAAAAAAAVAEAVVAAAAAAAAAAASAALDGGASAAKAPAVVATRRVWVYGEEQEHDPDSSPRSQASTVWDQPLTHGGYAVQSLRTGAAAAGWGAAGGGLGAAAGTDARTRWWGVDGRFAEEDPMYQERPRRLALNWLRGVLRAGSRRNSGISNSSSTGVPGGEAAAERVVVQGSGSRAGRWRGGFLG